MDTDLFWLFLHQKRAEIERAIHRTIPAKARRLAKSHFQDNFRKGSFVDGGLQPWARKKRTDKYGPLMSGRQDLYGSISYRPGDACISIGTEVPEIHRNSTFNLGFINLGLINLRFINLGFINRLSQQKRASFYCCPPTSAWTKAQRKSKGKVLTAHHFKRFRQARPCRHPACSKA